MKILMTNDDGFGAAGQIALFKAARSLGEVVVVAPACPQSMKSHAVTTSHTISIQRIDHDLFGRSYVCDGTPADCVRLALRHLPISLPDVVLSGINHGANAGVEVYYSGTVAAAREAVILGRTGVAVSQLLRPGSSDNWSRSREMALDALRHGLALLRPSGEPVLLNINLPDVELDRPVAGIRICSLTPEPLAVEFAPSPGAPDPPCEAETTYTGRYFDRSRQPGSDFDSLLDGWITLTPLLVDLTDHTSIQKLTPMAKLKT